MKVRSVVAPVLGVLAFFGLWELFVRVGDIPSFELRPPSQILRYLFGDRGDARFDRVGFASATLETGFDAVRSIVLALVIGFVVGSLMAASRWLEEAALPVLILVQVTPWVVYSASVVLWLDGGQTPVLFIGTLVCVPAFSYATTVGLRSADPATLELMRTVDASWWETLWRVRLPHALPGLFTATRFAIGLSIAAVYFTEGGALVNRGLGAVGKAAINGSQTLAVWSTAFCAAFLGALGLILIGLLERLLLGWHASQRRGAR